MTVAFEPQVSGRIGKARESGAPADVQAVVRDVALVLGASAAQAREAARTGRLALDPHTVAVVADYGGQALLLCVELGSGYLSEPARAHAALVANMRLFVGAGMAFALGATGPVLLMRRPMADAQTLADGVRQMVAMARIFGASGSAGGSPSLSQPADTAGASEE